MRSDKNTPAWKEAHPFCTINHPRVYVRTVFEETMGPNCVIHLQIDASIHRLKQTLFILFNAQNVLNTIVDIGKKKNNNNNKNVVKYVV